MYRNLPLNQQQKVNYIEGNHHGKKKTLEKKGDFLKQQRTLKLTQPKQLKKKDMLQLWQ